MKEYEIYRGTTFEPLANFERAEIAEERIVKAYLLESGLYRLDEPLAMQDGQERRTADLIYVYDGTKEGRERVVLHRVMHEGDGSYGYGATGCIVVDPCASVAEAFGSVGYEVA